MVKEGDRIELVNTSDEYTNLEPGDRGTVTNIDTLDPEITGKGRSYQQVWIDWDSGSKLALIKGEDEFKVIDNNDQ